MDKKITRRNVLAGAVSAVAGATIIGKMATPAEAGQPHMQAALRALNNALGQLQAAERDKAGHRENAVKLVNDAIAEVQAGIAAGAGR
ncbi:MAG TPA: hypothetical protein VGO93_13250 [Candidatus Xenobia bacterium]|jgi:hypothetical protein